MTATRTAPQTYRWQGQDFTEAEIAGMIALATEWAMGPRSRLDAREVQGNLRRWALAAQVVEWRVPTGGKRWAKNQLDRETEALPYEARYLWRDVPVVGKVRAKMYYTSGQRFNPTYDLAREALWRMVRPLVDEAPDGVAGFHTVTTWAGWELLGLLPVTHRFLTDDSAAQERMRRRQFTLLGELHKEGYITFLAAGNVWEVRRSKYNPA